MKNAIPDQVLVQHTAILGKTGSGKTSTAKLAVEQIVRNDPQARVCVLDTVKSDFWGLTSSADGKRPGLPFHILGGPRGHVPLHSSAGKAIGELVGTGALPLSIIDMADFEAGGASRFFIDFAPALLKKARGVVHLVIEEAHELAPKERSGIGNENMAIHWAKKLATAGRSKGIRLVVLTQRTQALHNALLGSCDTIIAHRLTAPADQEPVKKWLKANVSKQIFEEVSGSLASLKTGSAWMCSGEAQVAELVQFPKISTYDNSATPTGNTADRDIKTATVDQDKLRAIIGDAVKEAEADDPKKLRAEIARLTAAARVAPASAVSAPAAEPAAVSAAEQHGYIRGLRDGHALTDRFMKWSDDFQTQIGRAVAAFVEHRETVLSALGRAQEQIAAQTATPSAPRAVAAPAPAAIRNPPTSSESLPGPQQRILNSLVTWKHLGESTPGNAQVAWLAGYSPSSSSYTNPRSALKSGGLIEYPASDRVGLTAAGDAVGHPLDVQGSILDFVLGNLPGPEARILRAAASHFPKAMTNEIVAADANYSASSSSYTNPRSALRTKDLITYPEKDHVRAADWLFAR